MVYTWANSAYFVSNGLESLNIFFLKILIFYVLFSKPSHKFKYRWYARDQDGRAFCFLVAYLLKYKYGSTTSSDSIKTLFIFSRYLNYEQCFSLFMREELGLYSSMFRPTPQPNTSPTIASFFPMLPTARDTNSLIYNNTITSKSKPVRPRGNSFPTPTRPLWSCELGS